MGLHWIGASNFELWDGEPPRFHQQQVEVFSRNGADGTAAKLHGKRGQQFTAELTSWFASYALARQQMAKYPNLIGASAQRVIYNGFDWLELYKTRCLVLDVQELECRAAVRLLGPGKNYPSGASLVTRWTMIPILETT